MTFCLSEQNTTSALIQNCYFEPENLQAYQNEDELVVWSVCFRPFWTENMMHLLW